MEKLHEVENLIGKLGEEIHKADLEFMEKFACLMYLNCALSYVQAMKDWALGKAIPKDVDHRMLAKFVGDMIVYSVPSRWFSMNKETNAGFPDYTLVVRKLAERDDELGAGLRKIRDFFKCLYDKSKSQGGSSHLIKVCWD